MTYMSNPFYNLVMPRQPGIVGVGYPHHIILRGNNRSAIFYKDRDRRFFIACLKDIKEKTKSKIYPYCLMPNHVHLLVEPSIEGGLKDMMQSLGRRYVQYINHLYKRTGTLWEGRFKLLDKDAVYSGLGKTEKERQLNYKRFFLNNVPDDELNLIRSTTQKCGIIGHKEFINKISKLLGRNVVLRPRGRPKKSL